jgi:hypothetical protein
MKFSILADRYGLSKAQQAFAFLGQINLDSFLGSADRDRERVELGLLAVRDKGREFLTYATLSAAQADLDTAARYADAERMLALETAEVIGRFFGDAKAGFAKATIARIFGGFDPLKSAREELRIFAKRWNLDPVFLKKVGVSDKTPYSKKAPIPVEV